MSFGPQDVIDATPGLRHFDRPRGQPPTSSTFVPSSPTAQPWGCPRWSGSQSVGRRGVTWTPQARVGGDGSCGGRAARHAPVAVEGPPTEGSPDNQFARVGPDLVGNQCGVLGGLQPGDDLGGLGERGWPGPVAGPAGPAADKMVEGSRATVVAAEGSSHWRGLRRSADARRLPSSGAGQRRGPPRWQGPLTTRSTGCGGSFPRRVSLPASDWRWHVLEAPVEHAQRAPSVLRSRRCRWSRRAP